MTRRNSKTWLSALIVAPVAAGIFGVSASWAATHTPSSFESAVAPTQSPEAQQSPEPSLEGVPASTTAKLSENQVKIDSLRSQLDQLNAQITSLNEQSSATAPGSGTAPGSAGTWSAPSPSQGTAPSPAPTTTPAPSAVPTPAPVPNTNSGAS